MSCVLLDVCNCGGLLRCFSLAIGGAQPQQREKVNTNLRRTRLTSLCLTDVQGCFYIATRKPRPRRIEDDLTRWPVMCGAIFPKTSNPSSLDLPLSEVFSSASAPYRMPPLSVAIMCPTGFSFSTTLPKKRVRTSFCNISPSQNCISNAWPPCDRGK